MGTINLKTASGGSAILSPANTATDVTITVPASNGTMALIDPVAGISGVTAINNGQIAGMRNRIINGDMRIAQRGTLVAISGYTLDRWIFGRTGLANTTVSQVANTGFGGAMALSSNGVYAAGEYQDITQRIEYINCIDLVGKTVTVSFYHNESTTAGTVSIQVFLTYPNAVDNFSGTTVIGSLQTLATSVSATKSSVTFTNLPSSVTNGLGVTFRVQQVGATGTIQFGLGSVQLEVGSTATEFEERPIGLELMLCQRYFEKSYSTTTVPGAIGDWASSPIISFPKTNNKLDYRGMFKVEKRISPGMAYYSPTTGSTSSLRVEQVGVSNLDYTYTVDTMASFTSGWFLRTTLTSQTTFPDTLSYGILHYTATAEL